MLWPFVERRERSARTPARRTRPRPAGRDWQGGAGPGERLETRRMLAADITLAAGVLTVSFDDTSDDAVSLSITPTGYSATGANTTSGTGTISQLVVLDAGVAKTSALTLLQADQILTGGLSIGPNVTAARFEDSVATSGGEISIGASCATTFAAITIDSSAGKQSYAGPVSLLGDVTLNAENDISFGAAIDGGHGLTVNAAGVTTFTGNIGQATKLASLATDAGGSTFLSAAVLNVTGSVTFGDGVTLGEDLAITAAAPAGLVMKIDTVDNTFFIEGTDSGAADFSDPGYDLQFIHFFPPGSVSPSETVTAAPENLFVEAPSLSFGGMNIIDANPDYVFLDLGANSDITTLTGAGVGSAQSYAGLNATNEAAFESLIGQTLTQSIGTGYAPITVQDANQGLPLITFASTVDGGYSLTANGATTFSGGLGSGTPLSSLTVNAGTDGAVTFSDAATTVAGNVSVTARNIVITADLVSTSGDITLTGDAGSTVTGAFHGVHLNGSGVEVKTLATDLIAGATGAITVQGRGGDAVAAGSGSSRAYGVYLQAGASISAGGSGDVSVTGIGGVSTLASFNSGVLLSNSTEANGVSQVITVDGGISVVGTAGGASGTNDNYGVSVNSFARITAGGSGGVSVTGTAAETGGTGNSGVIVTNFVVVSQNTPTAAITSSGGEIAITGTGTASGAAVVLRNAGKVTSGGSGNVTITADSMQFDTAGWKSASPATIGSITAGAAGDATVSIGPRTKGTLIDLGGSDSLTSPLTLGLSTAEIDRITAGTLSVGSATAGVATVSIAITPANVTNLAIHSGAGVTLAGHITTDGGTITIDDGTGGDTAVTLANSGLLDTTSSGATPAGAAVTVRGTVTSDTTNIPLQIQAGTDGDVLVTDKIGAVGAGQAPQSVIVVGNDISLAGIDGVIGNTYVEANDGTDTGSITLTGLAYATAGGFTLSAGPRDAFNVVSNPITLAGGSAGSTTTFTTAGNLIELSGAINLNGRNLAIDTTAGGANATGAPVFVNDAIDGAGTLSIDAGTGDAGSGGEVSVNHLSGAVGGTTPLTAVTLINAREANFGRAVNAGTLSLLDATESIIVQGVMNLTAGLVTTAEPYTLAFLGGAGGASTIAGTTAFLNTGSLQLGDAGNDTFTFAGGVLATAPSVIQVAGRVAATTGVITLGDADTGLLAGGGAAIGGASTGDITIGDVSFADGAGLVVGTGIANSIQVGAVNVAAGAGVESFTIDTTAAATVTGAVDRIGLVEITNSGGTTFQAAVTAGTVTLTDTTGTVTFQGVLTADSLVTAAEPYAVAILADGSEVAAATVFSNTGGVTFGDAAADTLTFTGGLTSTAGATTLAGTLITDSPAADIGAPSRFGDLTLAADSVIDAGSGDVFFDGTVVGPGGLEVTAAAITATSGLGQSANRLANLTFTGASRLGGFIYTDGDQTYDGDVTIEGGISVNTSFSTPATVRFTGLVDGDGVGFGDSAEFTLYGGTLAFDAAVGSQQPLASITVQSAANVALAADATTTGQQSYNAGNLSLNGTYTTTDAEFSTAFSPATATTLTGDTTIATGSGNVSLGNVAGELADTRSLTITSTGTSSLAGPGGSGRLASVSVSGGEARVGGMATSGSQTYGGSLRATNPSLLGNPEFSTAGGGLSVAGATVLAANGTVSFDIQGGQLTFTGPVDNNDNPIPVSNLAINASADVVFGAAVGMTRPILNLSVTTPGNLSLAGNVRTWPGSGPAGVQTYAAKVLLGGNATLSGLSASFSEGLDGTGHDLTLVFADSVAIGGGFTGIGNLTSTGATTLAGAITTSGDQEYAAAVTLAANATLTAGGDVGFRRTLDGAHDLNIANAANASFDGDVGSTTPLADLTVRAPSGTINSVLSAITTGGVAFHSANQAVAEIETTGAVNGSAGTGNLTLNATTDLFAFGNLTASRSIATGAGQASFNVPMGQLEARASNGSVSIGGNTTVGGFGGTLAVSATGGNITFGGALNECGSTAVVLGTTGDILFRGEVRDLEFLAIFAAANVTAEAAVSGVGIFGQQGGTGTTTLADVSTISGMLFQTGTVNLTGSNYTTGGEGFTIDASVAVGTGGSVVPVGSPGILTPSQLVTIQTSGGNVTISGGTDGIYAARPQIVPNMVVPAAIIGSDTSLAIDAGTGEISLGGFAGFGSGGLLGLPLLNVTLAGSRVTMPAVSNFIAGTFSVTEGAFRGSGTVGNLAFDPATTLAIGIADLTPVTGYGQLTVDVSGTVDLDSAALTVSAGFPVPVGTILTLIDNQGSAPVTGTFAGLPEGATVTGSGGAFRVSYVGGDGNDVTLEAIAGDIVVSVVDNRVVITLASTGTTVSNLSTRYLPRGGRLVITVAADQPLAGGGTGVTVNDAAGTVSVRLAQLPGFTGIDVIGGGGTDLITVGPGGINLAAVTRGAADQSVSITTGTGSADTVTITRPVRMKGRGSFTVATPFADGSAGIRLGTTVTTPRGPQVYLGDVTLVGPTTVTAAGMLFNAAVDGPHRLTVNATGEAAFLGDVGLAEPLTGMTIQKATSVLVMGGFRLDGTGLGPRANGLVVGRNVNNLFFSSLALEGIAPAVPPRTIAGFGGSGILFQGGSTGSTIRDVAIIGNGRGMTFQPGSYAGTVVQANAIADSARIGICLNGARGLTVGGDGLRDGNAIGSAATWRAYATGIYAMGNLTGTRISGNTISLNAGNGIVMRNARGLLVGGTANTIIDNGGWGLIASGTSTGSVVAGNTISGNAFGQVNIRRARGLRVVT